MNELNLKLLKDPAFLMVLLATFVKKAGGEIKFTEDDLAEINTSDLMGLFRDPKTDGWSVKILSHEDYEQYMKADTDIASEKPSSPKPAQHIPHDDDDEWEN